jgi:ribosomal protein L11 methyltransferase
LNWIEVRVTVRAEDPRLAAEIVAERFHSLGVKGVVVEDPAEQPPEGWPADGPGPPPETAVTAYFADTAAGRDTLSLFEGQLAGLAGQHAIRTEVQRRPRAEEDWAEAWKNHFHPVRISAGLVVKPSWRDYHAKAGEKIIELDPGMAFGTGTHPTTISTLRLIECYLVPGQRFLDVGTGSGILMIGAALLGASVVHGVDNDETAVDVARDNLRRNRIEASRWRVRQGHLTADTDGRYHLVAANILADVVMDLLADVGRVTVPGGTLVCSGILERQAGRVTTRMQSAGFRVLETLALEEWVGIAARWEGAPHGRPAD